MDVLAGVLVGVLNRVLVGCIGGVNWFDPF